MLRFRSSSSEPLGDQGRDRPKASLTPLISLLPQAEAGRLPRHKIVKAEHKPGCLPASGIILSLTRMNSASVYTMSVSHPSHGVPQWGSGSVDTVFSRGQEGRSHCLPSLLSLRPERIQLLAVRLYLCKAAAILLKGWSQGHQQRGPSRRTPQTPKKAEVGGTTNRLSIATIAAGKQETPSDPCPYTLPDPFRDFWGARLGWRLLTGN